MSSTRQAHFSVRHVANLEISRESLANDPCLPCRLNDGTGFIDFAMINIKELRIQYAQFAAKPPALRHFDGPFSPLLLI